MDSLTETRGLSWETLGQLEFAEESAREEQAAQRVWRDLLIASRGPQQVFASAEHNSACACEETAQG